MKGDIREARFCFVFFLRTHWTYGTYLLLLLRFICRPRIKDIVLALAGPFEVLFCLFLHFVLLVYNFLVHIIGFSK